MPHAGKVLRWVPVRWSDAIGGYAPDLPEDVGYAAEIPSELDTESPKAGHPAVAYCPVWIKAQDVPKVTTAIPEAQVSEEDRLLIALCRTPRDGRRMDAHVTDGFFRDIRQDLPERGAVLRRLLMHAVRRGLPWETAKKMAERELPAQTKIPVASVPAQPLLPAEPRHR